MTVAASNILTRVRLQLIDTGDAPRWSDAELLGHMSDGQRTIVAMSPSAASVTDVVALAEGTRQTLPGEAYRLLSVNRNMGTDGLTPGRAVRIITRELLDAFDRDWPTSEPQDAVENYLYDPAQPTVWEAYPPQDGEGYVQLTYARTPDELTATSDLIAVTDIYQTALTDYTLFRAYQKDNDFGTQPKAGEHLQLFLAFMGQGKASDLSESPNLQLGSYDPTVRGAAK